LHVLQVFVKSDPWDCPPLNLWNWNEAWRWKVHAWESVRLTSLAFAEVVNEQEKRSPLGRVYQVVKSNR